VSERLLTVGEMARATGSPQGTIRRWIREELIEVERIGPTRRVRIKASVVLRLFPYAEIHAQSTTGVDKPIQPA
jgi:excisionase family DNA binding protein